LKEVSAINAKKKHKESEMKTNVLLSITVLLVLSIFAVSSAWAEGQPKCPVTGGDGHQCLPADEAKHQCLHSGENQQAEKDGDSAGLEKTLDSYFAILASLSKDSMDNVQANAKDLAERMSKVAEHCRTSKDGCGKSCRPGLLADASAAAKSLSEKADIGEARSEFGVLSEKLAEFLKNVQEEGTGKLHVFKCDMAKKVWLQKNEDPGNPYYGPSMAKCRRKIN
jgi:hypothetical protein